MHKIRLLLNGKKAGLESVRQAVLEARRQQDIEVRVSWEAGDIRRLVIEAISQGCRRIVAGGGDGTLNEVVNALMSVTQSDRPELAILPLGTANDFATSCGISQDPLPALQFAQRGAATTVDCVRANDRYFLNVASGGFGALVTNNTPVTLKNFLGGGAYTLSGVVQALQFSPFRGRVILPDETFSDEIIVAAVCNGRQAGGGQQLAPKAYINDGLLNLFGISRFQAQALPLVLEELRIADESPNDIAGQYVKRFSVPWIEWDADDMMPVNLDGEPIESKKIKFEVQPRTISLVLADTCPLLLPT